MRVLLISHGFPPESVGGVEQHVAGLSQCLAEMGHEVEIYTRTSAPGRPQGELRRDEEGPCPVTRVVYRFEGVDSLERLYGHELLERALQSFLDGQRFDVAHVHHLTGLSTGSLRVLSQAGIPTVLTLHDYWLMCPRGQMWHRRHEVCEVVERTRCASCLVATFPQLLTEQDSEVEVEALHRRARSDLSLPQALVVPSARIIPPFAALGVDPGRFQVVENGVDTEALAAVPLPDPDPRRPLRIGYLGTAIPSKGLHVLVEAFQRLPPGSATLKIHGNSVPYHGEEGYLSGLLQTLGPGHEVTYHGPYQTAELPRILGSLDLVAAPSLWHEAFGLTVREGLAAGRPAVVSRIGGLQDAVDDGVEGILVPPGDVEALSSALGELATDRGRLHRMARACRGRVRGFAAMARDLLGIYSRLASLDPPNYNS